jgi:site-specific recombinase XerD
MESEIKEYLDYALIEKKLSINTIKTYNDDLKYYMEYFDNTVSCDISINDKLFTKLKNVYRYAIEMTEKETMQAVEAMYHNLNTL